MKTSAVVRNAVIVGVIGLGFWLLRVPIMRLLEGFKPVAIDGMKIYG